MEEFPLLSGKRVLLVDDEIDVLETLGDLLSMCDVTMASHYEAAKDYIETRDFDLAVLDIMGVEGYALLELAVAKEVPAAMLTAHALSPDNIVKSFRGGAASYLPKEEMVRIASFLEDILDAKDRGQDFRTRWSNRLSSFFERKFGPGW